MRNKIRRFINKIKEVETGVIWLFSVALIVILIILAFLISIKDKEEEESKISIPLTANNNYNKTYTNIDVVSEQIDKINKNSNLKDIDNVYGIEELDYTSSIEKIINDLNITNSTNSCVDQKCFWNGDGYFIEYNKKYQRFFLRIDDLLKYDTDILFEDKNNEENMFKGFVNKYFGENVKYSEIQIVEENGIKRLEAIRMIEGVKLIPQSPLSYTDYLLYNSNDEIYAIQITLIRPDLTEQQNVDLLDINDIEKYINNSLYSQKTYYLKLNDLGVTDDPDDTLDFYSGQYDFPYPDNCYSSDIEIGYSYIDTGADIIFPVYKVECSGEVNWEGRRKEIKVIKVLNAVDPKHLKDE